MPRQASRPPSASNSPCSHASPARTQPPWSPGRRPPGSADRQHGRLTGARMAGMELNRVAELLVTPGKPGPGRRGSGYYVTASAVLTAAHVVRDAARVRVRFDADRPRQWLCEGTVHWSDPTSH